jgi:sugar phosphate isomerase/epimerase
VGLTSSRRDVLKFGVAGAAAAALGATPRLSFGADEAPAKKIPIGLELYSVRNEMKADFTGTIEKVGKIGYEAVEFAGYYDWDKKPKDLRKLLDDNGLKCCGTHTHLPTLEGDELKKTIELHKTLGNKFLICPSMSAKTAADWENLAKKFNDIAAKCKESDMFVGYHSHAGDFKKLDNGKTPWEIFFDNTDPIVIHQLDVGNTLDGGGDPLALIKKYPGRTKTTHLKEHGGPKGAAIGEGTNDWKALFAAYESVGGIEVYVVEHETSNEPLVTIKTCLENLHKMGK